MAIKIIPLTTEVAAKWCTSIGCSGIHPKRCPGDINCSIIRKINSAVDLVVEKINQKEQTNERN